MRQVLRTQITTSPNGTTTVTREVKIENRAKFLELLGKHHNLWTGEIEYPDEVLSRLLGIPKALLPAHLDDPDAIEAEAPTELPAHMALDANRVAKHDVEKGAESEAGKLDDELNANQQLTDGRRFGRLPNFTAS